MRPDFDRLTKREERQFGSYVSKFLAKQLSIQKRRKQIGSARNKLEAGRSERKGE